MFLIVWPLNLTARRWWFIHMFICRRISRKLFTIRTPLATTTDNATEERLFSVFIFFVKLTTCARAPTTYTSTASWTGLAITVNKFVKLLWPVIAMLVYSIFACIASLPFRSSGFAPKHVSKSFSYDLDGWTLLLAFVKQMQHENLDGIVSSGDFNFR